jgi:hypothetical protein
MPDGTSNTVVFAERYRNCAGAADGPAWGWIEPYPGPPMEDEPAFGCATAGIGSCPDYNWRNVPFQVAPSQATCNIYTLQGAHAGSMQIGMGDGCVRSVSSGISERTWELACYPNDGNPLPSDW